MGGVHLRVLRGNEPALAARYPSTGGDGNADAAWPQFLALLDEPPPELVDALRRPPQTNEVGRSASMIGGFLTVADEFDLPLRVLVNGRTASGAEIVAGAIRDSGQGLLVGERTYGKGTVQQILPLSDASSLHVTSSEWFTPARRPLDQVGLEPDVTITPDPSEVDNQLAAAIEGVQVELTLQGAGTT